VVARSVAALSKGPNRVLGYVENMSGYYCRDCNAIKPLFASDDSRLRIPCLGSVPFDPELARHCDLGTPFTALRETPVGIALDGIAQRLFDDLENTTQRADVECLMSHAERTSEARERVRESEGRSPSEE
jgi:hypothetical protein